MGLVKRPGISIGLLDHEIHVIRYVTAEPSIVVSPLIPQPLIKPSLIDYSIRVSRTEESPISIVQLPIVKMNIRNLHRPSVDVGMVTPILQSIAPDGDLMRALGLGLEVHGHVIPPGPSSLFNCEGTTIIQYPGEYCDKGLDESLAMLAVELERIFCGKSYDPRYVMIDDEDIDFLIRDEGVYVIRGRSADNNVPERVGLVFKRFIGYGPKVIIISDKLLNSLGIVKPSILVRVNEVNENALRAFARAYTGFASGRYCDDMPRGVDALASARLCLGSRLRDSVGWVLAHVPHKLRPSVGGVESEAHLSLKAAVIRYLIEGLGLKAEDFQVEDEVEDGECGGAKPDIWISSKSVAIDVKSSVGALPTNELIDAVKKYIGCGEVWGEVWVVYRPIAALLFAQPLIKTLEVLQKKHPDRRVRVMVPMYNRERQIYELTELKDFLEALREELMTGGRS